MNLEDDVQSISHIYEESWKTAYKGMIPQSYLDNIPKGHWVEALKSRVWQSLILLEGKHPVGTAAYCPARDERFKDYGEIVSIYLLPEYMGKGYGKQLFQAVMDQLLGQGYKKLYLWVLEENERAIRFYKSFGFKASGIYLEDHIDGKDLREIQYIYEVQE